MNWFYLLLALCFCLLYSPIYTKAHLLPDELLTDDAEQLEREKRSGFFDRILKSFPWFKKNENNEEEDTTENKESINNNVEDPIVQDVLNDDDITASFPAFDMPDLNMHFKDISSSSERSNSLMEPTSDTARPTDTISTLQTSSISRMNSSAAEKLSLKTATPSVLIKSSSQILATSSATAASSTTPSHSDGDDSTSVQTLTSISPSAPLSTFISTTDGILPTQTVSATGSTSHISVPTATAFSSLKANLFSSLDITPTPSITVDGLYLSATQNKISPFVEIIMGSGPPQLPDERGYGEVYAQIPQSQQDDHGAKSMRVMMSSLFVPVMSGLFGALCVALVISFLKCVRRRRLKKIKYYGGKPESRLYGLDHMGLLSGMSSDEED